MDQIAFDFDPPVYSLFTGSVYIREFVFQIQVPFNTAMIVRVLYHHVSQSLPSSHLSRMANSPFRMTPHRPCNCETVH